MNPAILAEVTRSHVVESIHRGHLIVLDGDGKEICSLGNKKAITFMRSSAKPFQVLPLIYSGGAKKFNLLDEEIAIACASHSGEQFHIGIVEKMLKKIGVDESFLQCGAHLPFNEKVAEQMIKNNEKPRAIHNNCSGKHAAMLAMAKHLGANLQDYLHTTHNVQQEILKIISTFTETAESKIKVGIDGCSAPTFALSMEAMAKAMTKLILPTRFFDESLVAACNRVTKAMMTYPEVIGGNERLDTILMKAGKGTIVSKIGAEGVWLCGILPSQKWKQGLAIALKIEDGDDKRARAVVAIELLRKLGVFNEDTLSSYSPLPVKNRNGNIVGQVRACFDV
ncbi:MAG: asparaginase [Pyrinomonadaceae bacterium]|nr:asparaginase [Pyrinomonadaceae bacterium]MCX7639650.1 asparaginase [Pyrinomonadaceae bacterium]MDW8303332.1 asparaginase [Acidobacteriota bacterium]